MLAPVLLIGSLGLACLSAFSPKPVAARTIRITLADACSCASVTTPSVGPGTEGACVEAAIVGVAMAGVPGICPGCQDARDCVMAGASIKYRLSADDGCNCDAATVAGTGADVGMVPRNISWNTGWSAPSTVGGHSLACSDAFSSVDDGAVVVTCTSDVSGGAVPRVLATVNRNYACVSCQQ